MSEQIFRVFIFIFWTKLADECKIYMYI